MPATITKSFLAAGLLLGAVALGGYLLLVHYFGSGDTEVVVVNAGAESLGGVSVLLLYESGHEVRGEYELAVLPPRTERAVTLRPTGDSHIGLRIVFADGTSRVIRFPVYVSSVVSVRLRAELSMLGVVSARVQRGNVGEMVPIRWTESMGR